MNRIIHGIRETTKDTATSATDDKEFVASFLATIGVIDVNPQDTVRLGKPNEKKQRPLKVVTHSDKDIIISKLGNLKNAEDRFKKLGVTDDYTIDERELIKEWVNKAKHMNEEEK